ncbi:hypothetical protein Tco_1167531 [Tanacetum coccineum]
MPNLLQSTSSHSVSSNFGNQFINSPNASLIGTILENAEAEINSLLDIQIQQDVPNIQQEPFHAVKVSVILEPTQIPPTTPPAPPLPAIKIPSTQVSVTPPKSGRSGMVTMGCYVKVQKSRYRKRP